MIRIFIPRHKRHIIKIKMNIFKTRKILPNPFANLLISMVAAVAEQIEYKNNAPVLLDFTQLISWLKINSTPANNQLLSTDYVTQLSKLIQNKTALGAPVKQARNKPLAQQMQRIVHFINNATHNRVLATCKSFDINKHNALLADDNEGFAAHDKVINVVNQYINTNPNKFLFKTLILVLSRWRSISIYTSFKWYNNNRLYNSCAPSPAGEGRGEENKINHLNSPHPNLLPLEKELCNLCRCLCWRREYRYWYNIKLRINFLPQQQCKLILSTT
jgi:hypothetical protein